MHEFNRRSLMTGLMSGALVLGLDPITKGWVTGANAAGPFDSVPALDGTLRTDAASLDAAADDFGHIVHHRPLAVLEPGSVQDVVKMVKFCRRHGIPVAGRGQGHSTNGQSQVAGGLVIELAPLSGIEISGRRASVGAGALWNTLLQATLPRGLTPPVLTDYIDLSVGGTLSAGGLGGQIGHHGAQVDNVLELEAVTGAGRLVTCSPTSRAPLFYALLSGRGQVGIITRATLRLVPAPETVRYYNLFFATLPELTAVQRALIGSGRFDYVEGQLQSQPDGTWKYMLEAVAYGATAADDARLTGDLGATSLTAADQAYYDFANRIGPIVDILKSLGEWTRPHPWLDSLLPASAVDELVAGALPTLTPATVGFSAVILLYPIDTAKLRAPLLRMPDERYAYLFSILRTASPGVADPAAMTAANLAFYETARARGGSWYPIGTLPLTPQDWKRHYGPVWPAFKLAKRTYDPDGILTPGQGIF
ncbi:FAD-binding protein [Actinocorallia longicatena]|uniref:FAD-binding PCMH-type domain-containing protein n=1 Tax=Actinocorallia longicatena TaxID=111803 RepID=A0ABP6Q8E2_9ACTN